jgi:hypothetical protein
MRLSKIQQEVHDNLMLMLRKYGREYMFGWVLGMLIKSAEHDPNLRRVIRNKAKDDS